MSAEEDGLELDDLRLPREIYEGTVVDVEDPRGVGRVRATIPGVMSPSGWLRPLSTGGGSAQRGTHDVPALNATILIFFPGGDAERGCYIGGYWGSNVPGAGDDGGTGTEALTRVRDLPVAERPHVVVTETAQWVILADDRKRELDEDGNPIVADGATLLVQHKPTGTKIEVDGQARAITLEADSIILRSAGQVVIEGLSVNIAGRHVRPRAGKI